MKRKGISNILLRKHEYESVVIWFYFSKKKKQTSLKIMVFTLQEKHRLVT
jgi:hypothetical protein